MAEILLVSGDCEVRQHIEPGTKITVVTSPVRAQFVRKPLFHTDEVKVLDAFLVNDPEFIKWVVGHSKIDTFILFHDKSIPAGLTKKGLKTKNNITRITGEKYTQESIWDLLRIVATSPDRHKVFALLEKHYTQVYMIVKWLIGNAHVLGAFNLKVLAQIDEVALLKNEHSTRYLLAFSFQPLNYLPRLSWPYPKKEN